MTDTTRGDEGSAAPASSHDALLDLAEKMKSMKSPAFLIDESMYSVFRKGMLDIPTVNFPETGDDAFRIRFGYHDFGVPVYRTNFLMAAANFTDAPVKAVEQPEPIPYGATWVVWVVAAAVAATMWFQLAAQ